MASSGRTLGRDDAGEVVIGRHDLGVVGGILLDMGVTANLVFGQRDIYFATERTVPPSPPCLGAKR